MRLLVLLLLLGELRRMERWSDRRGKVTVSEGVEREDCEWGCAW